MLCVGFLEETIFRGLPFTAIAKDNIKSAAIISSVTFGIGHIINLFNGSGMDLVNNLCRIVFAVAVPAGRKSAALYPRLFRDQHARYICK